MHMIHGTALRSCTQHCMASAVACKDIKRVDNLNPLRHLVPPLELLVARSCLFLRVVLKHSGALESNKQNTITLMPPSATKRLVHLSFFGDERADVCAQLHINVGQGEHPKRIKGICLSLSSRTLVTSVESLGCCQFAAKPFWVMTRAPPRSKPAATRTTLASLLRLLTSSCGDT